MSEARSETALAAQRAKEEVSQATHQLSIHFLGVISRKVLQEWGRSDFLQRVGVKEGVSQRNLRPDGISVVIEELDIVIDEGVTDLPDRPPWRIQWLSRN